MVGLESRCVGRLASFLMWSDIELTSFQTWSAIELTSFQGNCRGSWRLHFGC